MKALIIFLLVAAQLFCGSFTVASAAFDSKTVKISLDEAFWDGYFLANPNAVSGDVEKIYKIKKVEVRLLSGDKEFGVHTFTPENSKPRSFSLLHGVRNTLVVRIKAFAAADGVVWVSSYPYQYAGNDIMIKGLPAEVGLFFPGI